MWLSKLLSKYIEHVSIYPIQAGKDKKMKAFTMKADNKLYGLFSRKAKFFMNGK